VPNWEPSCWGLATSRYGYGLNRPSRKDFSSCCWPGTCHLLVSLSLGCGLAQAHGADIICRLIACLQSHW
jgi:hypothetical protein